MSTSIFFFFFFFEKISIWYLDLPFEPLNLKLGLGQLIGACREFKNISNTMTLLFASVKKHNCLNDYKFTKYIMNSYKYIYI